MLSKTGSPARKARRCAGGRVTGPASAQPLRSLCAALAAASPARTRRISDSRALELASKQKPPPPRWKISDYAEKCFPMRLGPGQCSFHNECRSHWRQAIAQRSTLGPALALSLRNLCWKTQLVLFLRLSRPSRALARDGRN